jgi:hypothetical protein
MLAINSQQNKNIFKHLLLFPLIALFFIADSYADAKLLVFPQAIVFNDRDHSQEITLSNMGDRTGVFTVQWVDYSMTDSGGLTVWSEPGYSPWSIQPFIRYSPRRVTLAPNESQVVKIGLIGKRDVPVKEYQSHIVVRTINSNLEANKVAALTSDKQSIKIDTLMGVGVPVRWEHGTDVAKAHVDIKSMSDDKISLTITREGLASTRGYLHVLQKATNGTQILLSKPEHLVIYPNLSSRTIDLSITKRANPNLPIMIYYSEDMDKLDKIIGYTSKHI